jgi:hypothetical protein
VGIVASVSRWRFNLETAFAVLSGACAVLTLFWPAWLELVVGWDPDHGHGAVEWMIIAVFFVVALVLGLPPREGRAVSQR